MPRNRRRRTLLGALAVALLVTGCGGADDAGADQPPPATDPLAALEAPPAGKGTAVLGIEELTFTVTACEDGPGADDPPQVVQERRIVGQGETSDGPFTVEILRVRSDAAEGAEDEGPALLTETAQVVYGEGDDARGLEARRTTAGTDGAWLDLTDPDVDEPLIEGTDTSVDIRATFGPERARAGDEGLIEGRLRATCPT